MTAKTRARKCQKARGVQLIPGAAEVPVRQPWLSAPHPGRTINQSVALTVTKVPALPRSGELREKQAALPDL